jgi:hypothetical protein
MLSARALGILLFCCNTNQRINSRTLSENFKEGREAIRTAVNELIDQKYMVKETIRIGSRLHTYLFVTKHGANKIQKMMSKSDSWAPENRVPESIPGPLLQQNEQIINNLYITKFIKNTRTESVKEGENEIMGYEFFKTNSSADEDELLSYRQSAETKKTAEYQDAKKKAHDARTIHRESLPKDKWTSSDIGYEFASRVSNLWNIKPWSLVQTRFIPALASARRQHETTGVIEYEMINLFFNRVDFNKYDNADILWKMFIKMFPALASDAKARVSSEEDIETAQVEAKGSWDWMQDV